MAVFDPFPEGGGIGALENKTRNPQELSLTLNLAPRYSTTHVASPHTKTSIIVTPH